jgi:hypothetical protein
MSATETENRFREYDDAVQVGQRSGTFREPSSYLRTRTVGVDGTGDAVRDLDVELGQGVL